MRRCLSVVMVIAAVSLATVAVGAAEKAAGADRFAAVARRLVDAINSGNADGVQREFAKVMRDAFGPDKATPFFKSLLDAKGKIQKVGEPFLVPPDQAVFGITFANGETLDMKIVLDQSDKMVGLLFLPHVARNIPIKDKHDTTLRLPFGGDWLVFWGGDTAELNQHHNVPNQMYAFDFIAVDSKGSDHTGDGTRNEDYVAFGREILAPAAGEVTDAIDGVRDNAPGSMNPYSAVGNAVFIRHREGEVSIIAHLKMGSVRVKAGEKVKAGQLIGLCGNSGNSSQPHLHYHLQNTDVIQDGTGIKVYFDGVTLVTPQGAVTKGKYSPVKGDIVRGAAAGGPREGKRGTGG